MPLTDLLFTMINRRGITLSLELRNYMKTAHPGIEISKPGYLKQRTKLNPLAFYELYRHHNRNFYTDPGLAESIIVQQNEKLVGLVYPDFDDAFAHGLKNEDIEQVMEENRVTLNTMLPTYSQVSKMKIYPEEFEKTPKKSIKRYLYQEAKG